MNLFRVKNDIHCVLIGDGPKTDDCQQLASSHIHIDISFTGYLKNYAHEKYLARTIIITDKINYAILSLPIAGDIFTSY